MGHPIAEMRQRMPLLYDAGHDAHTQHDHHERGHRQRRIAREAPADSRVEPAERGARRGEEHERGLLAIRLRHVAIDLPERTADPPHDSPGEQNLGGDPFGLGEDGAVSIEVPGTEQTGDREDHAADEGAVRDERRAGERTRIREEGGACEKLQEDAEDARGETSLSDAHPHDRGALERPRRGRPARVERERDREAAEDNAQRQEGFGQKTERLATAPEDDLRQHEIDRAERERAPRRAVLDLAHQSDLQSERHERDAKHERSIHVAFELGGAAVREQNRNCEIEGEEEGQERLRAREVLGPVEVQAPQSSDGEREREAHQVQDTPCLEPGDDQDAGVQHGVVAE
jgi:hypothetical protein